MNQMRPGQKNRNQRHKNGRKPMGNVQNRVYESAGPEGKVRGTPQQIIEKYLLLARDAQTSGDRVVAENFLQHAEHYIRLLGASQPPGSEGRYGGDVRQLQGRADYEDRDDDDVEEEAAPAEPHRNGADDRGVRDDRGQRDERVQRDDRGAPQARDDRGHRPDRDPRDQGPRRDREHRNGFRPTQPEGGRAPAVAPSPLDTIDPSDDLDLGPVATPEDRAEPGIEASAAPAPSAGLPPAEVAAASSGELGAPPPASADREPPESPAARAGDAEAPPAPRRRGRPRKTPDAETAADAGSAGAAPSTVASAD